MLPVAVATMMVPGLTTGSVDNAVKSIVLHSDEVRIARIYDVLGSTEAGADLIQKARIHGLPTVKFERVEDTLANYDSYAHKLTLNPDYRDLPVELAAPSLAHELSHRTRRWYLPSIEDEVWAHIDHSRVWRELKDQVGVATLSPRGLKILEHHNLALNYVNKGEETLVSWIKKRYPELPRFGRDLSFDRFYVENVISRKGR